MNFKRVCTGVNIASQYVIAPGRSGAAKDAAGVAFSSSPDETAVVGPLLPGATIYDRDLFADKSCAQMICHRLSIDFAIQVICQIAVSAKIHRADYRQSQRTVLRGPQQRQPVYASLRAAANTLPQSVDNHIDQILRRA